MRVKNKIIEQLDENIREDYYEMLDEGTQLAIGNSSTPAYYNVVPCGERFLIIKPKDAQLSFCEGRVMSLYDYFPDLKTNAEFYVQHQEGDTLLLLDFIKEQYDPQEVFDFFVKGVEEKTLHDFIEHNCIEEHYDQDSKRIVGIYETLHKGEWKNYCCMVFGNNPGDFTALEFPLERNLKRAMRYFSKRLSGEDKKVFDMLGSQKGVIAE